MVAKCDSATYRSIFYTQIGAVSARTTVGADVFDPMGYYIHSILNSVLSPILWC